MNFKCFFGFHDYKPVGMYWIWGKDPATYTYTSISVVEEYECTRCGNIRTEIIQAYSNVAFNLNKVAKALEANGIPHRIDYVRHKSIEKQ